MLSLKPWQTAVLALPIALIVIFLLVAAGTQIHDWGINWIWGIVILVFLGWRWLLVKWTKPAIADITEIVDELDREFATTNVSEASVGEDAARQVEVALQNTIQSTRNDAPIWEDWQTFWQRCQEVVVAVAHTYHPEVKRPLLNIYLPQNLCIEYIS